MDSTAAHLARRYLIAGLIIAAGVVAGSMLARREHERDFPAREVAAVPCVEACTQRERCLGHGSAELARCAALCAAHAARDPDPALRATRCLLDGSCAEAARCATPW